MKASKKRGIESSSDENIDAGSRSASSSSFTISTMILFSILIYISPTGVRSFSFPKSCGEETFAKHHDRKQQTILFVMKIRQQQQEHQQYSLYRPVTTKLNTGNIDSDDDDDDNVAKEDSVDIIASDQGQQKNIFSAANDGKDIVAFAKESSDDGYDDPSEYDLSENLLQTQRKVTNVGDPQLRVREKKRSVTNILKELAAIQQQGPQKYCILGTRHCSYLHQQIIELLAYALVLSGNHVYTSGASGTHAATVRGALRAEREDLLTVVLPQSLSKQTKESQELLKKVDDVISMPQNDDMSLDVASRICNSYLLSLTDQLISFAFHESNTVIEASKEAKALDMLVTTLYLD